MGSTKLRLVIVVKAFLIHMRRGIPVKMKKKKTIMWKFRLSEKHTKFEKIFLMVWTLILSKCTKHEEDCANFCVLLRKSELELCIFRGWNQSKNTFRDLANFKSSADITAEVKKSVWKVKCNYKGMNFDKWFRL